MPERARQPLTSVDRPPTCEPGRRWALPARPATAQARSSLPPAPANRPRPPREPRAHGRPPPASGERPPAARARRSGSARAQARPRCPAGSPRPAPPLPRARPRRAPGFRATHRFKYELVLSEALDSVGAELASLRPALAMGVGQRHRSSLREQQRGQHQTHRPAAEHAHVLSVAAAGNRVERSREWFGHRRRGGGHRGGDPVRACAGAAIRCAKPPSTHLGARQICGRDARHGTHFPQAIESETRTRSPVSTRTPAVSWPNLHGYGASAWCP